MIPVVVLLNAAKPHLRYRIQRIHSDYELVSPISYLFPRPKGHHEPHWPVSDPFSHRPHDRQSPIAIQRWRGIL